MSIFRDKTLMITGGTGSFGNAALKYIQAELGLACFATHS